MTATPAGFLSALTPAERRQNLAVAIASLLRAMNTGEVDPTTRELEIVATMCDEHQLPIQATRVRREIRSDRS